VFNFLSHCVAALAGLRIALESRHRLTQRVRELQRRGGGQSLAHMSKPVQQSSNRARHHQYCSRLVNSTAFELYAGLFKLSGDPADR